MWLIGSSLLGHRAGISAGGWNRAHAWGIGDFPLTHGPGHRERGGGRPVDRNGSRGPQSSGAQRERERERESHRSRFLIRVGSVVG
jgi:hypothetical protein